MNVQPFLHELRAMLANAKTWHPSACANREGYVLGEFQQSATGATWDIPVAWNLPCAIRFLTNEWKRAGRLRDTWGDMQAVKMYQAAYTLLAHEVGDIDLWLVTDHAQALAAIAGALRTFGHGRSAA